MSDPIDCVFMVNSVNGTQQSSGFAYFRDATQQLEWARIPGLLPDDYVDVD